MRREKGFTLLEIMITLAIAAVIMSAGVAPLLYTSRMMQASIKEFSAADRERSAVNRIFADVRSAAALNSAAPVVITPYNSLAQEENDFLIVRTLTTTNTIAPLANAVWGVPHKTPLRNDFREGLYRWTLSDDISPGSVAVEELDPKNASLLLPGIASVSFSALRGSEWTRVYEGQSPGALRVTLAYPGHSAVYEELMPNF